MMISPRTIDVVADLITGGTQDIDGRAPIGLYLSGPKIAQFMRGCDVDFVVTGSRVPDLTDCIMRINRSDDEGDRRRLTAVVESAADPRDFLDDPERGASVLQQLNAALVFDELEVRNEGSRLRLVNCGKGSAIVAELASRVETFDFDTV